MKLKKGFLSLLIATVLASSALIVPSISVYAATKPKTLSASATTSNIEIIKEVGLVHDIVHNVYVYAGLANVTGNSGTYTEGILITLDTNGNILTSALAPHMDQFQSIVTDEKGDVVIGSCYNEYTSVPGANAQPIPEYMATYNYVYTTSDGGMTWSQTASGDRMVDFNTGMYYTGYDGTMYLGRTQSITYSENQFIATGEYGSKYYSTNGYNWHQ
ncbi:hypothetical protein [Clostridium akagii]|uniref:hypothetical protein n=1 Tax=Clostridium akagii TaxID=91623 RepID=UPI00047AE20E|nr:hypothetical protein [Clostridium akagii]